MLIITDSELRFHRLQGLLAAIPGFSFVCTYHPIENGLSGLGTSDTHWLLFDFQDYRIDPLQCIKQARFFYPDAQILAISSLHDTVLASRILRAGANAYLTDTEAMAMLDKALRQLASGDRFVSEDVMQEILQHMVDTAGSENHLPVETLSDREMIVFQLLGAGKNFHEIAGELNVSIKTVATHGGNIRRKLQSRDNAHLMRMSRAWAADHHHEEPVKIHERVAHRHE